MVWLTLDSKVVSTGLHCGVNTGTTNEPTATPYTINDSHVTAFTTSTTSPGANTTPIIKSYNLLCTDTNLYLITRLYCQSQNRHLNSREFRRRYRTEPRGVCNLLLTMVVLESTALGTSPAQKAMCSSLVLRDSKCPAFRWPQILALL